MSPIVFLGCEAQWVWPIDGKITAAIIDQGKQVLCGLKLVAWTSCSDDKKQYVVNYFILMG